MTDKLKPCPFCGRDEIGIHEDRDLHPGLYRYSAECDWCSGTAWGEACTSDSKAYDSAIEAWNTRTGGRHAD